MQSNLAKKKVTRPPRPFPWKGAKERRQHRAARQLGRAGSAKAPGGCKADLAAAPIPAAAAAAAAASLEPASLLRRERHVGRETQLGVRGVGGRA